MKWRCEHISAFAVLLFTSATANAQQCSDCDCFHFPISIKCDSCCGVSSGTITSVTNSTLDVAEKSPGGETVKRTFSLKPNTRKNSALKEGAPVTVYYRKQEGTAAQVDVVAALKGLLLPGNEADPPMPSSCRAVPPNALRIYLGDSAGWTSGDEVTALKLKGTDIVALRRTSNGLAIVARLFGEDGSIVAQIIDNHFYVNPGNFLMKRPDSHSLEVFDQHDRKALDISYINRHSVSVLGIFQFSGVAPIVVSQNGILIGRSRFSGECFGDSPTIFDVR